MDKEFVEIKNEYYKYLNAFEGYRLMDKEFDNVFFIIYLILIIY